MSNGFFEALRSEERSDPDFSVEVSIGLSVTIDLRFDPKRDHWETYVNSSWVKSDCTFSRMFFLSNLEHEEAEDMTIVYIKTADDLRKYCYACHVGFNNEKIKYDKKLIETFIKKINW